MRIFNTYGPRMALDDGRVVSNFLAQALTGQPMTVYGDGSQSRSFQYISDLIQGTQAPFMASAADTWPCATRCAFTGLLLAQVPGARWGSGSLLPCMHGCGLCGVTDALWHPLVCTGMLCPCS